MTAYTGGRIATDTDAWLAEDLTHTLRAQITDQTQTFVYDLDVLRDGSSLTMDEAWAPYIQGTVVVVLPSDAATLAALDPRTKNMLWLFAGYKRPDGSTREVAWPWAVYIRRRVVDRVAGTVTLTLASGEAMVQDYQWTNAAGTLTVAAATTCQTGVAQLLTEAFPAGLASVVGDGTTTTAGADLVLSVQAPDAWAAIKELADRAGCQVWPLVTPALGRDWAFKQAPLAPSAGLATSLITGPTGFVTAWTTTVDRDDDWANTVAITYKVGTTEYYRAAEIGPGVGGSTLAGRKTRVETRNVSAPPSATVANSLVNRAFRRGVKDELTAIAAYWLEPRQSVYLPDGTLRLVQRVSFNFGTGLMSVTTRSDQ